MKRKIVKMMKKRVLIASYNMIIGGSTTALIGLLNSINYEKYEVDLVLYKNEGDLFNFIPKHINVLPQAFLCEGKFGKIKKYILGLTSGYLLKGTIENFKIHKFGVSQQVLYEFQVQKLSRKINKKYDVAIGFLEGWADRFIITNVNANIKIGWLHSTFSKIGIIPKLEFSWLNDVDKIVFVAESCKIDFLKKYPLYKNKTYFIPNIIDANYIKKCAKKLDLDDVSFNRFFESSALKIITVCRLSIETKGLDRIVLAAEKLKKKGYSFLWIIVGDGDDRTELQKMIEAHSLTDVIFLAGARMNPYPFLAIADLMCMPSRWEGMPSAVTEAKILGTPSLVTEYLSAHEQILNGIEGIIVKNQNDSIFEKLEWCINNKEKLKEMRKYLLEHHYGTENIFTFIEKNLFGKNF